VYSKSVQNYYVASLLNGPSDISAWAGRAIIEGRAKEIRAMKGDSSDIQRKLEELVDTQKAIRDELSRQQGNLTEVKSGYQSNEKLLSKKMSRQDILEAEMKDLERTAQELASLIDVLRTRSKEEAAAEKQARLQKQMSGQAPILPRSLPWPIKGRILTKFGRQDNPKTGTTYISNGVNIGSEEESSVLSVADGKVLYAGQFMSYGSMVVLEHPGDWYTVYGHLARWDVEKGQELKKGEMIGQARLTSKGERETYFEIRFYGKPTDPLPWLSQ
jgi:septal ring factor EnvC (AmiA/AmiB activator)